MSSGWASRPARSPGPRFRGRTRRRGYTWSRTARIVAPDRGHEFVFATEPRRGIYHDTTTWRYHLEPAGGSSTRVIERYLVRAPWWIQVMDTALGRPKAVRRGMQRTLANLKHAAEQQAVTDSPPINHAGKDDDS